MTFRHVRSLAAFGAVLAAGVAGTSQASAKDLTLCWAAWDPANALVELSKDFEAKSGVKMKFEFVPWPNFADRMLNELNSGGKLCDLMIGDSQWIGGAAENGQYVKLNDFFDKEGIKMDDFIPATVVGYAEWPKNSPNYWALPAFGDVVGWSYRKDWFARPELQAEFKQKYGRDLAVPKTFAELKDIAEFFQKREIDGKTVYGAAIYTERGSEGITMGAMDVLYSFGFQYENPDKPYELDGFVNSAKAVQGLEFYKQLYDCCTPPGHSDAYMSEDIDAYKSGQVALHMNFAFTWPGINADANVGGDKSGYFPNPAGPDGVAFAQLGGQGISIVSYSKNQEAAFKFLEWFVKDETQKKWAELGGYTCNKSVLESAEFQNATPYNKAFYDTMFKVKDFWAVPEYAELLTALNQRVYPAVIGGEGSSKETLDALAADWTATFKKYGRLK